MDDSFYITFLRARKFNVEKTVKLVSAACCSHRATDRPRRLGNPGWLQLRRFWEMRRRYPEVCRFAAASKHRRFHETRAVTVLQDRALFEAPIVIAKIGSQHPAIGFLK